MTSISIFRLRTLARFAVLALVVGLVLTGHSTKPALAACGTTNLALNQPATASSTENGGTTANLAVDGSQATRWGSAFSDPQWLQVDLGTTQSICGVTIYWEAAYATAFQIQVSNDAATWTSIYSTTTGTGGTQALTGLSGSGRYIRMYGTARATGYGYSIWEFQVFGGASATNTPTTVPTTAGCGTTNVALNKLATASSVTGANTANLAFDGNNGSRWESLYSDPQWIQVDLGSTMSICQVVLNWETAAASSYQIQVSNDATNWTTIYSTTTSTGGTQTLSGLSGSGRYVRMYGTARTTQYGYSIWEFQVYSGTSSATNTPVPTNTSVPATATPTNTATNTPAGPPTNTPIPSPTTTGTCGTTNIVLNQPATASSTENGGTTANLAVDGSQTTRWSSAFSDPQWLQVDLGTTQNICGVTIYWEAAYATAFQIQVSNDAATWASIYSTTTGTGGTQNLTGLSGSGRYIRMYGTARATGYGYSIWEFQVFAKSGGATATNTPPGPPTNTPIASPTNTSTPTATATSTVNWTTVWSDDFLGAANTAPSASNWIIDTGTPSGTGEVETNTTNTANVSIDGVSHLKLTAIKDGSGNWTSSRIESQRSDFAANAGQMLKVSAILQQPNVPNGPGGFGYWPAFWMLGAPFRSGGTWPSVGEVDMMENVNARDETSSGLHCGTNPKGVCNEGNGRGSGLATCIGCKTGYHEYSVILDRTKTDEELRWYLDGVQTWILHESQVGVTEWSNATHHGFFIIFDLAMGGAFPNAVAGVNTPTSQTTSGGSLLVDSVTVSTANGSTPPAMTDPAIPAGPSVVKVTGSQGNWQLTVNGSPWFIKGITFGPSQDAGDGFMRDIQSMGVNTIRTWGVDTTNSPTLLNNAAQYGIKVIMGHWLNQGADYLNDTTYKTNTQTTVINAVNQLKGYQGLLMWDVGNEVILTTQDHTYPNGATVEQERVAYAQYVEQLVQAIHAADPNHPVTSTDAWTGAWPYYKSYTPDLDLLAVNSYGAIGNVKTDWQNGGYTKPYIITEGGPSGEWEVPNDVNGVPTEPTDQQKRDGYTSSWAAVTSFPGVSLGATEFNYGLENDFGGVWLNFFSGGWHRLGYYSLRSAFGGQAASNTPPVISSMTLSSQTAVPAGGTFNVSVAVSDPNGDPLRYYVGLSPKYITNSTNLQGAIYTMTSPGNFTVTAPQTLGVWKVYVYVYDAQGNVGIETKSFKVVLPPVPGTNIAINKPVTTSSVPQQNTTDNLCCQASFVNDGNTGTRWASPWADPQWIQIDLGSTQSFSHVQLAWEAAYASAYQIQTSNDGATWTTIYSTTTGVGGVETLSVSGSGRYVRMNGTARGTTYGYSLWEFGIYQ